MADTKDPNYIKRMAGIGIMALQRAKVAHDRVGARGILAEGSGWNPGMQGLWYIKNAVGEFFKYSGLHIISDGSWPSYMDLERRGGNLALFRSIDDVEDYKEGFGKGRYAALLAIYDQPSPAYDNYIFTGRIELANGRMFYAVQGMGAMGMQGDKRIPLACSPVNRLTEHTHVSDMWKTQKDFRWDPFGLKSGVPYSPGRLSAGATYADLAAGSLDAVIARNEMLGIDAAVGYGLVHEAGGVMANDKGELGSQKYFETGYDIWQMRSVLAASTQELAKQVAEGAGLRQKA